MECSYCATRFSDEKGICPKCGGYTPETTKTNQPVDESWETVIWMISMLVSTILVFVGYKLVGNALIEKAAKLFEANSPFY